MSDTGARRAEAVPALEVRNVKKHFGGVAALNGVSFSLAEGEVLGIVGDNGAGKSTLIKIISGVYTMDEGEILVRGERADIRHPNEAKRLGIETVYQDLALVDDLDIPGNIFLGREQTSAGVLGRLIGLRSDRGMAERAAGLLRELNVHIPGILRKVRNLSGGQRQVVALSKVVFWGRRIVILDEPTAALGVQESGTVLDLIRRLKEKGISIIIISHNLQHVFTVVNRVMVLRRGECVGIRKVHETSANEIVSLITGAEVRERV
jgi:ABC-type sugar transport system ATPase subunit